MKLKAGHIAFIIILSVPLIDTLLPRGSRISEFAPQIMIYALLGLGLNIITGYTGLLNLGVAAFMAIGAYAFAILTCEIYPFQVGFWGGLLCSAFIGALAGVLLGLPTIRLRGDYLAIVTLGFGEIVQDILKNLDNITKGTQGINPLPYPSLFGYTFTSDSYRAWYYLLLAVLLLVVLISRNLERSRAGRSWIAIREDELAATCMGVNSVAAKLGAFSIAAAVCSLSGALWASYLGSTGEPSNYDFQVSVLALCIIIVGGMGNIYGVLVGAALMIGFNSVFLVKLSEALESSTATNLSVFASPNNWKYLIFGLALILTMRFRPEGVLPSQRIAHELHAKDEKEDE